MAGGKMASGRISVEFCILDIDYVLETDRQVLIRIWGRTRDGKTVAVLDRSFRPYFYILPKQGLEKKDLAGMEKRVMELIVEGKKPLKTEILDKKIYGKSARVLRVTLENPTDVPKFRDLVKNWKEVEEEYEYAISFYRRYLVNQGLMPMTWVRAEGRGVETDLQADIILEADNITPLKEDKYPNFRVMAFDLEALQRDGEEKIIMLSMRDTGGFSRVLTYRGSGKGKGVKKVKDEKALIEEFLKTVRDRDPDILVTYNGDGYDFPRLDERSEKYGMELTLGRDSKHMVFRRRGRVSSAQVNGRVHVDLYNFIDNILSDTLSSEILTLDSVSREILGKGKRDMDMGEIEKSWKRNVKELIEYCRQDSELTLELSKRMLPQIFGLCRVTGQKPFDVSRMSYSQLVEWLLIREAFKTNEIIPNMPRFDEIQKRRKSSSYVGGYVYPPEQGLHDNIALYDFASLYPNITITHNVSPETLDHQCCSEKPIGEKVEKKDSPSAKRNRVPGEPHYFCLRHKGFIPGILERLVGLRSEIRERMNETSPKSPRYRDLYNRQYALKILANASYGYYGYPGSRWYSKVCAQAITAWGRFYIQKVIAFAKNKGYRVIYGDTDSLFLKVKNEGDARKFLKSIKDRLPKTMRLEFKDLYKSGIFVPTKTGTTAKKRYALIDSEGGITIRGFERVRRDWSRIAKETQEQILLHILRDKSPEKALSRVRSTIKKIEKGKVDFDDLVIYTQITKPLEEYEQISPHVAAARKAMARGTPVKPGSVIAYIISKGAGSISDRAVPLDLAKNYDPEYYIHNQVLPAALRVLAGLGYTEDDVLKKRPQSSLEKFMGRGLKHKLRTGIKKLKKKG